MPQGLQVFDAAGNLIVDIGSKLGRFLGSVDTGSADGSLTNAGFATGTPFSIQTIIGTSSPAGIVIGGTKFPDISFSGTTMTWSYAGFVTKFNCRIVYGVY